MNSIINLLNKKFPIYCFSLAIFGFSTLLLASEIEHNFNLTEVADGVFLHGGMHVSIENKQHDDIANIGFIIGNKCVAVIDTGGSINMGRKLFSSIRSITNKPICYVINTHVHFDHILGNKVFSSEKVKFVGHHQLAEAVEHNRVFFLDRFKNDLGANPQPSSIISPNILVHESMQLDIGERSLTLIPFKISHSYTDLIIIDNKTKTLWSGDLIFRQRIPSLTGSLRGWLKAMDKLKQLDVIKVIPGHGSAATSMQQAIKQQQDYLRRLLVDTRHAIAKGQFLNDAMETIDKDNKSNYLLHEYQHASNVSKAFTELEWE